MISWSYCMEPVLARTVFCEHLAEESCFPQDKEEKEGGKKVRAPVSASRAFLQWFKFLTLISQRFHNLSVTGQSWNQLLNAGATRAHSNHKLEHTASTKSSWEIILFSVFSKCLLNKDKCR